MTKEDKEWEEILGKYQNENDSSGRYSLTRVTKKQKTLKELIGLSHAMRPGLQIRHFWVAKSLFLTITFNQKKQDKTFFF